MYFFSFQKTVKMPKGGGLTAPMKVSPELAAIIGMKEASRAQCVKHLWAYLKEHNLQDPENKQFFTPDKKMAKVSLICSFSDYFGWFFLLDAGIRTSVERNGGFWGVFLRFFQ